jgi:hypothetical protein
MEDSVIQTQPVIPITMNFNRNRRYGYRRYGGGYGHGGYGHHGGYGGYGHGWYGHHGW